MNQEIRYQNAKNIPLWIKEHRATLLCVGPMSELVVDACIELAEQYKVPVPLIASRRQVEAQEFGGGYVNNWSTQDFAKYVQDKDKTGLVCLARDHGGPYQNIFESEKNYDLARAMASAKKSFEEDIDSGFQILHLDPSVAGPNETLSLQNILDRLFELYEHCHSYASKKGLEIQFELGTEEQSGYGQDLEAFKEFLRQARSFWEKQKLTPPLFVVSQTGTKVLETENVGKVSRHPDNSEPEYLANLRRSVAIAKENQIMIKEHNGDYIGIETLQLRPIIGIQGCNVAPEFGVVETRSLIFCLRSMGLQKELDRFLEIAHASGKWKKWMKKDTTASDHDKSVICGHYVFSHPEVTEIRSKLGAEMKKSGLDLDHFQKQAIKASISRYLFSFNMI